MSEIIRFFGRIIDARLILSQANTFQTVVVYRVIASVVDPSAMDESNEVLVVRVPQEVSDSSFFHSLRVDSNFGFGQEQKRLKWSLYRA